jgi:hypothetical protein
MADGYRLRIAKRGNRDRNAVLRTALEQAEADFTGRPTQGNFFTRANPLTLDIRFGAKLPKTKKPQV